MFSFIVSFILVFGIYQSIYAHNQQIQREPCTCDFSNIAGNCVCTNLTVRTLDELTVMYPDLCPKDAVIHQLYFAHLPQLHNISDITAGSTSGTSCGWNEVLNLTLADTGIRQLQNISFANFSRLTSLNISHNAQLGSYGNGIFQDLGTHLTILIAKSNPVRSLTKDVFAGMSALTTLILSDNKIGYIETGVFSQNCCAQIRELRLDRNILTVLDADNLNGLYSLEILDLRNNPLQHLDSAVFSPCAPTLTELYMSHNDQTPFGGFDSPEPELFSQLSRLTVLHMIELKLKNLTSDTFRGLNKLRELSLRGNRLIQLPPDVFSSLKKLEYLDLSANWLICISSSLNPEEQSDFLSGIRLRWLDLSWNRLTHLNHLSARSLGLFDAAFPSDSRLVLNLTANPWQQIDEDTFCHPNQPVLIRPTDFVVGPVPTVPFGAWRTSLGLWYARVTWPYGPFSLIGPNSRVFGLMLNDENTERLRHTTAEEQQQYNFDTVLYGTSDALKRCQELKVNGRIETAGNSTQGPVIPDEVKEVRRPSATLVAFSLSSYCPRLPIHKLEDWELSRLKVSNLVDAYDTLSGSPLRAIEKGSRLYLLIIVGVCITFLLIALTVIMCYRAWSRRTSQKCVEHDLEGCPTGLTLEGTTEKHLLLKHQRTLNNGNIDVDKQHSPTQTSVGKSAPNTNPVHPNARLTSATVINGSAITERQVNSYCADSTHGTVVNGGGGGEGAGGTQPHSSVTPAGRGHFRSGRPKSDSEANSLDETHKLTAFGIV
ncbi:unnamed protein product [Calicophoron daubneyi]|uniref:Uncharacterized protein n=1 Tax=Calicophoron daubneyi TaxID=300641 RepID=A0AAV2TNN5_CALDB